MRQRMQAAAAAGEVKVKVRMRVRVRVRVKSGLSQTTPVTPSERCGRGMMSEAECVLVPAAPHDRLLAHSLCFQLTPPHPAG